MLCFLVSGEEDEDDKKQKDGIRYDEWLGNGKPTVRYTYLPPCGWGQRV
jgi:hypothetical protein